MRIERRDLILKKLSGHLYYEFWMFGVATDALKYIRHQEDLNLAIESFGIHARALVDFLFKTNGTETDVLAVDYINDSDEWKEFIKDKKEVYDYVRKRVGKEIAHLTTNRLEVTPELKKWDCPKIHKQITDIFMEFLKRVPDSRLEEHLLAIKKW